MPRWSRWYWMSVGRNAPSRQPSMTCLLRSGACQYTSTSSSSALTRRGGSRQSLADLRQEEDEPVGPGAIALERGVGLRPPARRSTARRTSASASGESQRLRGQRRRTADSAAASRDRSSQRAHRTPLTLTSHLPGSRWPEYSGGRGRASWLCLAAAACGGSRCGGAPRAGGRRARSRGSFRWREAVVLETVGPPPPIPRSPSRPASRAPSSSATAPRSTSCSPSSTSRRRRSPSRGARCGWRCGRGPASMAWTSTPASPIRDSAAVVFMYARYFAAPGTGPRGLRQRRGLRARARGRPAAPNGMLALLPSTRPVARRAARAAAGRRHLSRGRAAMTRGFEALRRTGAAGGGMVPVTRQVVLDGDTPVTAFAKLHRGRYGFLLESLEGGERWARYTFLATEPREVFRYRGRECARWTAGRRLDASSRPTSPRSSTSAGPCAATRRSWCPACPASPAARSASGLRRRAHHRVAARRAARRPRPARRHRDGGRHAARARQSVSTARP